MKRERFSTTSKHLVKPSLAWFGTWSMYVKSKLTAEQFHWQSITTPSSLYLDTMEIGLLGMLSAYNPSISAQFMRLLFSLVLILDWKKITSRKPTVLLMRTALGRNLGLAHQARNSCELWVEIAVQYTVIICSDAGSRLSMQPLLSHKPSLASFSTWSTYIRSNWL